MSTSAVSAHRVSRGIRTIGRELAGPDVDETRGFSRRVRRMAVIYVVATLPIITLVGGLAQDRTSYILIFVLVGSAAYATPAMIVGWAAVQRAPAMERYRWMLWASGVTLMFIVGVSMLVGLVTGWRFANGLLGTGIVVVINVLFVMSLMALVRLRSGDRVLSVDIIESVMSIVVLSAPFVLLWGERVVTADDAWYAVPASVATFGLAGAFYWTVVLLVRLGPAWTGIDVIGLALAFFGTINGAAQVAQGVSGFTLPGPPLILVHATCMGLLMLVPMHVSRIEAVGLERLPPQAQVRGAGLASALTLAGLPVLLLVTVLVRGREPWAMGFALGAVATLVVLAAVRQLLAVRETQRLYAQVEKASEERRDLLAQVVQRADEDRHRVATRLHQQAVTGYTRFVSFVQAVSRSAVEAGAEDSVARASDLLRDDLAQQAESLRQLMMAIRPLAAEPRRSESFGTVIRAYVDSLYRDSQPAQLEVEIDDDMVLDWVDETVALRILQEAIRNIWRHSGARHIEISIRVQDTAVELRVVDDGIGFDPDVKFPAAERMSTGLASLRSFTVLNGGSFSVESAPGEGTTVTARLGDGDRQPQPSAGSPPPHLRLVASDGKVTE